MKHITYSSAGHHDKDSGAIGVNGRREADETKIFRDLVNIELHKLGKTVVQDDDKDTLGQYLGKINPADLDVVVEPHFNAFNGKASGVEVLIADNANSRSRSMAKEIVDEFARIMGIANRGVKTESQSARGKLALMRKKGAVALPEICFIDNASDMRAYDANKVELAKVLAKIMAKYDLNDPVSPKPVPVTSVKYTTSDLNIRSGSGASYPVLHVIRKDGKVHLLGGKSGDWVEVLDCESNKVGWVSGKYLK